MFLSVLILSCQKVSMALNDHHIFNVNCHPTSNGHPYYYPSSPFPVARYPWQCRWSSSSGSSRSCRCPSPQFPPLSSGRTQTRTDSSVLGAPWPIPDESCKRLDTRWTTLWDRSGIVAPVLDKPSSAEQLPGGDPS